MANWIADALSHTLQCQVQIGSVNMGFLNRIILNDIALCDQQGVRMLKVSRLSAAFNYMELAQGNIVIPTAQLFSPTAILYRDSLGATPNYQFLIDALSSDSTQEETPLNLRINSFILRHANISYDVKDLPHSDSVATLPGKGITYRFDPNHLQLKDVGMNVSIKALTNDSLNLVVKRLTATELNTGLSVQDLGFALEANKQAARLAHFSFNMPGSRFSVDSLHVHYRDYDRDGTFSFDSTTLTAILTPADFKCLLPTLRGAYSTFFLVTTLQGNSQQIDMTRFHLQNTLGTLQLNATATATLDTGKICSATAYIADLHVATEGIRQVCRDFGLDEEQLKPLLAIGDIDYTGSIGYTPRLTASDGQLLTQAGRLNYEASIANDSHIEAHLLGQELNLGTVFDNPAYGIANLDINAQGTPGELLSATGQISAQSEAIDALTELEYHHRQGQHQLSLTLDADRLVPHALGLPIGHQGEQYRFRLETQLSGSSIDDALGFAHLRDVEMRTDSTQLSLHAFDVDIEPISAAKTRYAIASDFLTADIRGQVCPSRLPRCILSMLHAHLPTLVRLPQAPALPGRDINFTYMATLTDNALARHLLGVDAHIEHPLNLSGYIDAAQQQMALRLEGDLLEYAGSRYQNLILTASGSPEELSAQLSGITLREESAAKLDFYATTVGSRINSNVNLQIRGNTKMDMNLNTAASFADTLGLMKTSIDVGQSSLSINDTLWQISPAHLSLAGKEIICRNLRVYNADSHIIIDGQASPQPGDSITIDLRHMPVAYILDAVNFTSVRFAGLASGQAVVDDLLSDDPTLKASLQVQNLTYETGVMGNADIAAHWDSERKAIMLDADIQKAFSQTLVHGYVSPANDDIRLDITARQTPAEFLNGYLDGVFNPITGTITGAVSVVGPLSQVDLVGEADATLNLSLLATDVPYQLSNQHVSLQRGLMSFKDIVLTDRDGHQGIVNGTVSHRYLSNFQYNFDVTFDRLLAYEERTFNIDKFLATVYATGDLNLHGRDGHPIYMTANVTPTRGSVFAYDAASPDAIVSAGFLEFRDQTPRDTLSSNLPHYGRTGLFATNDGTLDHFLQSQQQAASQTAADAATYRGDLYMDFNINLNEDCEIKLRMDNTADGYITTRGNGQLAAKYYNKGTLELFGTYNITRGSYRLYLQNLIFRDLAMQPGSSVEFNGPPFDANIHLICHHVIPSVPLSDLTSTNTLTQTGKARVNCILDITGNLAGMAFKFDFDLLGTNEEVKQLVRSMINSEEEMNTQMIYLLGLGRFYPTSMARANADDTSSSAVNSLVSSTISGQINNMISNLVGRNSNWNFGTGISTGERGWEDLDVEGTLSGRLFNDRLLINGNFGYRDNAFTNQGNFIGDFEVKWQLRPGGSMYLKAYNQTNERYFTKAALNTQGIGLSYQHDFESWRHMFRKSTAVTTPAPTPAVLYIDSIR